MILHEEERSLETFCSCRSKAGKAAALLARGLSGSFYPREEYPFDTHKLPAGLTLCCFIYFLFTKKGDAGNGMQGS